MSVFVVVFFVVFLLLFVSIAKKTQYMHIIISLVVFCLVLGFTSKSTTFKSCRGVSL